MIKKEYEKYEKACYSGRVPEPQRGEIKQAFYSGAYLMSNVLIDGLENSEDYLEKIFDENYKEIKEFLQSRGQSKVPGSEQVFK